MLSRMPMWKDLFKFVKLAKLQNLLYWKETVCCSQRKREYFCATGNKSFKCFSQKNILYYNIIIYIIIYFYIIIL